jgi:hypothetical protein
MNLNTIIALPTTKGKATKKLKETTEREQSKCAAEKKLHPTQDAS